VEQYRGNVAYRRGDLHRATWLYERALWALRDQAHAFDAADISVNLAARATNSATTIVGWNCSTMPNGSTRPYSDPLERDRKLAESGLEPGAARLQAGRLREAWSHLSRALRVRRRAGDRENPGRPAAPTSEKRPSACTANKLPSPSTSKP
jgi:hypothetical protein